MTNISGLNSGTLITGGFLLPQGNNTTDKPTAGSNYNGLIRYNTTNNLFEVVVNAAYSNLLLSTNNLSDVANPATALNNILPTQTGNNGKVLSTNGSVASWVTAGQGTGSVTSVSTGAGLSGGPITSTGTISLASISNNTLLGNVSGSSAAPVAISTPVVTTLGLTNTGNFVVTLNSTAATGAYNFNLPGTAGTAGQVLTSQGGGSNAMTWVTLATSATTDTTNASNIASGSLALTRIASVANNTVLGNVSGSSAAPIALTQAQLTALLNVFSTSTVGAVPVSPGGTTSYLRADGTWATLVVPASTYTIQPVASGTTTTVTGTTNTVVSFQSTSAAAKTCTIPAASTTSGQTIIVKDSAYTAGTYNITITPVSGTIDGQASLTTTISGESYTLIADGVSNWMVV